MKKLSLSIILAALGFAASTFQAQAWLKVGAVFLDVNTNLVIDAGDVPVPGVLIIVTNFLGTFSNATVTAQDGSFSFALPEIPQSFEDFIEPSTLPPGITEIRPRFNVFDTSADAQNVTNFFLLENVLHLPLKIGHVFCDANTNRVIDEGDVPVAGALVVVTNFSGTFSNGAFSDASGFFAVQLPQGADLYGDFVVPSTLPPGSTVVIPAEFEIFQFSIPAFPSNIVTNDFLIQNPDCLSVQPPPQTNNQCWMTGSGTIKNAKGRPIQTFGGVVNPRCKPTTAGGKWNHISHEAKLQFKALTMQVVNCGNVPGFSPGSKSPKSPFNYIDFQGVGQLKGIGGNKTNYGAVHFYARTEDHQDPGKGVDRYYLRVFDTSGNTLLLISANASNPLEVAPVPISNGNFQLRVSGCATTPAP